MPDSRQQKDRAIRSLEARIERIEYFLNTITSGDMLPVAGTDETGAPLSHAERAAAAMSGATGPNTPDEPQPVPARQVRRLSATEWVASYLLPDRSSADVAVRRNRETGTRKMTVQVKLPGGRRLPMIEQELSE